MPETVLLLRGAREAGHAEERQEPLRLEKVPLRPAFRERELLEDPRSRRVTRRLAPLALEPLAQLDVALVALEHLAHVQLWRDRAVPLVGLEPEGAVVVPWTAQAVEPPAEPEGDRATGVAAVGAHAELEVLPLAHRAELRELAARQEQRDVRFAQAERREPRELVAQLEGEVAAVDEGVDGRGRPQVVLFEGRVADRGELVGERRHVRGLDREPGRSSVPTPALEVSGAAPQAVVQVEAGDRRARPFPVAVGAGNQDDRPRVALDQSRG